MTLWRATVFLLTGLAGGSGARLALTAPERTDSKTLAHGAIPDATITGAQKREKPQTRPAETDILNAPNATRLRLLLAWLPGAREDELRRMADALAGLEIEDETLGVRLLLARWAEVEPNRMVEWAAQANGEFPPGFFTGDAIEAWARVDFDAAWLSASKQRQDARAWALRGLALTDPDKCLDWLRDHPSLMELRDYIPIRSLFYCLAARAPETLAALAALAESGSPERLPEYMSDVALAWARADPAAAIAWMRQHGADRHAAAMEPAAKWIAENAPEHLPALLESIPSRRLRSMASAAGFTRLAGSSPEAAQRQIDGMPPGPSRRFFRGLLMSELLRRGDEAEAIALASQIGWSLPDECLPGRRMVMTADGSSSSGSADYGSEAIHGALVELMGRVAVRDPQQTARILAGCEGYVVSSVLTENLQIDHAALATAMLETDASGPGSWQRRLTVIGAWSAVDPAAAATWAVEHVAAGEERDRMMEGVFSSWSGKPTEMLQWAGAEGPESMIAAWRQLRTVDPDYVAAHPEALSAGIGSENIPDFVRRLESQPELKREFLRLLPDHPANEELRQRLNALPPP